MEHQTTPSTLAEHPPWCSPTYCTAAVDTAEGFARHTSEALVLNLGMQVLTDVMSVRVQLTEPARDWPIQTYVLIEAGSARAAIELPDAVTLFRQVDALLQQALGATTPQRHHGEISAVLHESGSAAAAWRAIGHARQHLRDGDPASAHAVLDYVRALVHDMPADADPRPADVSISAPHDPPRVGMNVGALYRGG